MRQRRSKKGKVDIFVDEKAFDSMLKNVMENGVLMWIDSGNWGNRKKVSKELMEEKFGENAAVLRGTQDLIDQKRYRAVLRPIDQAKSKIRDTRFSLPWINDSEYYIRKERVDEAEALMKEAYQEREEALDDLIENWNEEVIKFAEKHPEIYDPNNYPSVYELRYKFRFRWGFRMIQAPSGGSGEVQILSKAMMDKETTKFKERIKDAAEVGIQRMRESFIKIVEHLNEVLSDPEKKFHESTVEKPKEFLEQLKSLDMWSDENFFNLLERTDKLLSGVYADDLRDDDKYRKVIGSAMNNMVKEFKSLPTVKLKRKLKF